MSNEHEGEGPRSRGQGFPLVPLGEARDYIAEVAKYGLTLHVDAFAQHLGHAKPSGGAFNNKIAAIRDWGLITRSGSTVTLTDLAKRLALPTDESQQARDLREAFLACGIFRDAYERNAKGTPLAPDMFGNSGVLNLGIAPAARDRFVRSFVKSVVVAGLGEERADGSFVLRAAQSDGEEAGLGSSAVRAEEVNSDDPFAGGGVASPDDVGAVGGPAGRAPLPEPDPRRGLRPAFRQSWEFEGGRLDISLALDHPLPREAYAHLGGAMAELIALLEEPTSRSGDTTSR